MPFSPGLLYLSEESASQSPPRPLPIPSITIGAAGVDPRPSTLLTLHTLPGQYHLLLWLQLPYNADDSWILSLAQTWHLSPMPTSLVTYTQVFQRHFNLCHKESISHHPPTNLFLPSRVKAHDPPGYLRRSLAVILDFTVNLHTTSAFFCPYCHYFGYLSQGLLLLRLSL